MIIYSTRDPAELRDYINGYKHIAKTMNGFSDQIVKFSDNMSELDALIRIVCKSFKQGSVYCWFLINSDRIASG